LPDEFDRLLEYIHRLNYEDSPDYEFLRLLFVTAIERLGYHEDEPYDWEVRDDQHEYDDLLVKIEQGKSRTPDVDRRSNIFDDEIVQWRALSHLPSTQGE
jgi:hypothetical protein